MNETKLATGDRGTLIVRDYTDSTTDKHIELWIQSSTTLSVPQLPWGYSLDDVESGWQSFNFQPVVYAQRLLYLGVGNVKTVVLHLGNTGTTALGGPTDLSVDLIGYVDPGVAPVSPSLPTISLKVGDTYKRAIPYVNDNGVWKPAQPYVLAGSRWYPAT